MNKEFLMALPSPLFAMGMLVYLAVAIALTVKVMLLKNEVWWIRIALALIILGSRLAKDE